MEIERNAGHHSYRCWLTTDEYERLRNAAEGYRDDLIVRLGGEVGLRSFEIPQLRPEHVRWTSDGEHYRLRVPRGKDTSGEGGKPRNAYLPHEVERAIHLYSNSEEIADDEPLIELTPQSVQCVVTRTAERVGDETGDPDWRKVSSHNLRRYFAHQLLVEEQINPRVVMKVGGWDKFESIEPYLAKPSENTVNEAFEECGRA